MHDQMYAYFYPFLYISQCGFRQGYNMETCLLVMIEQERKSVDDGRLSGAVVTDQSNASDCINHDLLIAKLAAFKFDFDSLRFARSCLTYRKRRTKIDNVFSSYSVKTCGAL